MTSAATPAPGSDPASALELVPDAGDDNGDESVPNLVDWDVALATARRLTKPGPAVSATEARAVVADLRVRAGAAEVHVKDFTGMSAPPGSAPVVVVDRPGWVQANSSAFDEVLAPLARLVAKKRKDG
ncbi:MAG: zinc-dependent metalloprotease, partial [Actinomycetota bacterium]|nr:zinc-dependent metalloprotease [Actinomycetota bacterium]